MNRIFTLPSQSVGRIVKSSALPPWRARQIIALCLAVAILNLSSMVAVASNETARAISTGEVTATGDVTVNGTPAVTGQTLFSGSVIATTQDSLSTLSLSNLSRLELTAETTLKLDFSATNMAGVLDAGEVLVSVPRDLSATITTANALVVADASKPAVFQIGVERGATTVSVQAGQVEMRVGDRTHVIAAGDSLSASADSTVEPAAAQSARSRRRRRLAWWLFGAGVAATIIIIIIAKRDEECVPIVLSPSGQTACL